MATTTPTLSRQGTITLLPAIVRLAWWRFKQMWHVLLFTWLGMLAMVMLVCAVPLFSQVAMTAGLRNELSSALPYEQRTTFTLASDHPTSAQIQQAQQAISQVVNDNLASYTSGAPHFSVQMPALTIVSGTTATSGQNTQRLLGITSYTMDQIAGELTVRQGRLPQAQTTGNQVEIALTSETARSLGVHVGSIITANLPQSLGTGTWTMRVVGIFSVHTNWESPNNFQMQSGDNSTFYPALASNSAISPRIASLQVQLALDGKRFFKNGTDVPFFLLHWSYPLNIGQVNANNYITLSQLASNTQTDVSNKLSNIPGTFTVPGASGELFDILPNYVNRIYTGEVVISASLILIVGLVLFLVSMMVSALIERQAATIAMLRSRGATRRHVFGTFAAQGIGLGVAALLAGPFVALLLVQAIARWMLPANQQSALNVLTGNPITAALSVGWYALFAVIVAVFMAIVAIRRATALDMLAFRRESARETRAPFWRRLHLDLFFALLVCIGYVAYTYLAGSAFADNGAVQVLLGLLALIAPLLILAAGITLFLRLFPLLLRLGSNIAMRGRKASAMLALAQMERALRPAARMILLLALGTAFALFMLTSIATQRQRSIDAAAYQVGADFSGSISLPTQGKSLAQVEAAYQHTAGVTSATAGYSASVAANAGQITTINDIVAVDADTFARTVSWSSSYADQSLSSLMALLVSHRADASTHDVVYALVDDGMWKSLGLSTGSSFILPTSDGFNTHFIVAGRVHSIPGIYDDTFNYGMIVDYQSYATAYAKDSGGGTLAPNTIWLQTGSDAASLTSVRHAYPELRDRRAILDTLQKDDLHVNIIGLLGAGVATALLLALAGTLFSAWLNASNRLTSFAILRALGMAPGKIAAVLLWELGIICAAALVLGVGLGYLLTTLIGPVLYLTDFIENIRNGMPPQVVISSLLFAITLGTIICICVIALALMARLVSRPSLGQTLRLNED
ncbi:MAG TPA: FtsX-like permease family protein [Ktedonobacteraceae bacterium]|nr:FtsX-like permease family protein [Ktedonobacteraceae bacterium]